MVFHFARVRTLRVMMAALTSMQVPLKSTLASYFFAPYLYGSTPAVSKGTTDWTHEGLAHALAKAKDPKYCK